MTLLMGFLNRIKNKITSNSNYVILVGAGFGIFFWIVDSVMDAMLFEENVVEQLFEPGASEIYIRLFVIQIFIGFSIYARYIINELKRSKAEFEKLSRRDKLILDSAGEGIFGLDSQGNISFVNQAMLDMVGYEENELIGRPSHEYLHHSRTDGTSYPKEDCPIYAAYKDGQIHQIRDEVFWKKNGTSFPVEYISTPIREQGKLIGAVVIFKDITEQKRAEKIRLENERLVHASKAKAEFLATMSHELRTPLNSIIGFSELMKQQLPGELNEKQLHYLDNVINAGRNLLGLINGILDFSRVEAGKMELTIEKLSLPELINDTILLVKEKAAKQNVILNKELDPRLDFIETDRQRFKQVLFNLLSNAVKFSKKEGGTVTIKAEKEGDMARFSVSDTGIGIKEEDMERLFKTFEQLDSGISREYGGVGFGLAISKKLLELQGGKIMVESKYGEGSTFTFILPIATKNAGEVTNQ